MRLRLNKIMKIIELNEPDERQAWEDYETQETVNEILHNRKTVRIQAQHHYRSSFYYGIKLYDTTTGALLIEIPCPITGKKTGSVLEIINNDLSNMDNDEEEEDDDYADNYAVWVVLQEIQPLTHKLHKKPLYCWR